MHSVEVATAGRSGSFLEIVDSGELETLRRIDASYERGPFSMIRLSEEEVAISGDHRDVGLSIVNLETGNSRRLIGHTSICWWLRLLCNPSFVDTPHFASISNDHLCYVWDARNGKHCLRLEHPRYAIYAVGECEWQDWLVTGGYSDSSFRAYDLHTERVVVDMKVCSADVRYIDANPRTKTLLLASDSSPNLAILDVRNRSPAIVQKCSDASASWCAQFLPEKHRIILLGCQTGAVSVFDDRFLSEKWLCRFQVHPESDCYGEFTRVGDDCFLSVPGARNSTTGLAKWTSEGKIMRKLDEDAMGQALTSLCCLQDFDDSDEIFAEDEEERVRFLLFEFGKFCIQLRVGLLEFAVWRYLL